MEVWKLETTIGQAPTLSSIRSQDESSFYSATFETLESIGDIRLRDDGIALKYATSAPAADLHNDAFRDPGTTKIASRSAAQIVEEKPRHSGRLTGVRPRLAEVPYWFPIGAR